MKLTSQSQGRSRLRVPLAIAAIFVLGACASTPPAPTARLQAAQRAIATAESAEAGRYAAVELAEARTELATADGAVAEQRMIIAAQFADQSRVEAEDGSFPTESANFASTTLLTSAIAASFRSAAPACEGGTTS